MSPEVLSIPPKERFGSFCKAMTMCTWLYGSMQGQMLYIQSRLSEKPEDMASANTTNLLISLRLNLPFPFVSSSAAGTEQRCVSFFRSEATLLTWLRLFFPPSQENFFLNALSPNNMSTSSGYARTPFHLEIFALDASLAQHTTQAIMGAI